MPYHIVRNIGEAPFLMQVYSKTKVEVEREKENVDVWASVKRRWKEGCPIPDGVILVEQLDGDDDDGSKKWKI
ncbi:hypothetical protein IFM89_026413 [Coptis chinensis]|uniref:DUF7804 domain-containing protein n=1 Tax=Coptis chinensis TaxID=261450 RepID=A0A835HME2_9MAGN|nr:hypothetical protein IFM89_026413 [Coptis chinensis]